MRTIIAAAIFTLLLASICSPVAAQTNPVPFLNNPTVPAAAVPGGTAFTLAVNGAGFVNGATILWNGSSRQTTFVSGTQLTAAIFASDIATANLISVTVSNPSPGGGVSNPVLFSVTSVNTSLVFTQNSSAFENWISQPTGLVAGIDPISNAPVLAVANAKCVVQANCVLDAGTIARYGVGGLLSQDIRDSPQAILAADFNGDGTLDYVTLGASFSPAPGVSFSAWLSLGISGAGLSKQTNAALPAGSTASPAPVAGDFNRDGHLDIVTGGMSAVYFVPGNGDGTLGAAISSNTESSTEGGLAAGDFNGDGILDLAVTNPLLNSVSMLFGNGDGTFKTPVDSATGSAPGAVVTGDFNGDGKLDLAVLDGSGTTVSISLGNGDGTFKPHVEYPAGIFASSLALGDYNGDGILDLAFSDTQCVNSICPANGSVDILLGNGDGTFQSQLSFAAGGQPMFIATTSLSTFSNPPTGRAGIAVVNLSDNTVSIFSPQGSQGGGGNPVPIIVSISPASAVEGSGPFTLTVNGSNFLSSSTISFGGQAEPTTFVSASQLTAAIPGSAIATPGAELVLVSTPAPDGGVAESSFAVVLPPPTISGIIPSIAVAGSPGFTLTINGANFVGGSTVNFDNASRPAAFVDSTQITTSVLPADVLNAGTINISVTDPIGVGNSGGGTSSTVTLTVVPANTQPTLGALSPASATAGGPSFTLKISGTGFLPSSVVTFGSTTVNSAYQSPNELQASIPASAIAVAGTLLVTVANSGEKPSLAMSFTVNNAVPDFNVSATTQSATVPAGQTASYSLMLTPANGQLKLNGDVTFSTSPLPPGAKPTFTPSNVPAGSAGTNVMLAITTTPHSSGSILQSPLGEWPRGTLLLGSGLSMGMMWFAIGALRGSDRRLAPRILIFVLFVVAAGLTACGISGGGGGSGGSSGPQVNTGTGTPAGIYTITVNAMSGNATVPTTVTLTVK